MPDPYLEAMMLGLVKFKEVKKDKFEEAIENDIIAYVDSLTFEEESGPQLLSLKMKKAKLVEELKESIKMPELENFFDTAFMFINSDGLRYLDSSKYETLSSEFSHASEILDQLDPTKEIPIKLQGMLEISDEMMNAIYEIAKGAYKEEKNQESLSLFVYLSVLDQTNLEYWYRVGIGAQKCGNIDLALKAYSVCIEIDSELVGARLFSAECHLINGDLESAEKEMTKAKNIIENSEVDSIWVDLLAAMENANDKKLKI